MDEIIRTYLERVRETILGVLAEPAVAIVVTGSVASDDFDSTWSDVDLLIVSATGLDPAERDGLVDALSHSTLPCPAHGLDLILYAAEEVREPRRVPRYEFSLATGSDWEEKVSGGGPYPGGLIDLAAARQSGRSLRGPPAADVIGPIPETWIREELQRSLTWHKERIHDPFHDPGGANAVLNACRALHFFVTGRLVSKGLGAAWFRRTHAHVEAVDAALAWRRGATSRPLERRRVEAVLDYALERSHRQPRG